MLRVEAAVWSCPIQMLSDGKLSTAQAKKLFAKGRNRKQLKKAGLDAA